MDARRADDDACTTPPSTTSAQGVTHPAALIPNRNLTRPEGSASTAVSDPASMPQFEGSDRAGVICAMCAGSRLVKVAVCTRCVMEELGALVLDGAVAPWRRDCADCVVVECTSCGPGAGRQP